MKYEEEKVSLVSFGKDVVVHESVVGMVIFELGCSFDCLLFLALNGLV